MIQNDHQAKQDYALAKQNHIPHWQKYLDSLSRKDAAQLKYQEEQKHLGWKAKWIVGKMGDKSVTTVISNGVEYTTTKPVWRVSSFRPMRRR